MCWTAISADFVKCRWVNHAVCVNNVETGKKKLLCSYLKNKPVQPETRENMYVFVVSCGWFKQLSSKNLEPQTKKREKGFSSKQKQHYLVCNDGLHPRLNSHAHNGYLIEFQSEWAQLKAMQ